MILGILKLLAFIAIIGGVFYGVGIEIEDFVDELSSLFKEKKKTIKERILLVNGSKKQNGFALLIQDTKNVLELTDKEELFPKLCVFSLGAAVIGLLIGFTLSNYFIAPVLAIGFCSVPFIYIKVMGGRMKKQISDELETTLSIITSSYIRSEVFIQAVEENLSYINTPAVQEIFKRFVMESNHINSDTVKNIKKLKSRIENEVFKEWCDAVISCQKDANLKYTLPPVVKKLSNIRLVSVRLDSMLYAPVKEFVSLLILLVFNIPFFYFLNRIWFDILVNYVAGKIVLTICAIAVLISIAGVIKITRPIEYRR